MMPMTIPSKCVQTCSYANTLLFPPNNRVKPKSLFAQASAKKLEGTTATGNTGSVGATGPVNNGLFGVKKD